MELLIFSDLFSNSKIVLESSFKVLSQLCNFCKIIFRIFLEFFWVSKFSYNIFEFNSRASDFFCMFFWICCDLNFFPSIVSKFFFGLQNFFKSLFEFLKFFPFSSTWKLFPRIFLDFFLNSRFFLECSLNFSNCRIFSYWIFQSPWLWRTA